MEDGIVYIENFQPMEGSVQNSDSKPPFPKFDEYPFPYPSYDPHGNVDHDHYYMVHNLFYILYRYITYQELLVDDHHIIPLDFTKYSIYNLCKHYGLDHIGELKTKPLFFFHHWSHHPTKWTMDLIQNSTSQLINCFWHPTKFKKHTIRGSITTFYLYQVVKRDDNDKKDHKKKTTIESTDYAFDEFKLQPMYDNEFVDCPEMASGWRIVMLYRREYNTRKWKHVP